MRKRILVSSFKRQSISSVAAVSLCLDTNCLLTYQTRAFSISYLGMMTGIFANQTITLLFREVDKSKVVGKLWNRSVDGVFKFVLSCCLRRRIAK